MNLKIAPRVCDPEHKISVGGHCGAAFLLTF